MPIFGEFKRNYVAHRFNEISKDLAERKQVTTLKYARASVDRYGHRRPTGPVHAGEKLQLPAASLTGALMGKGLEKHASSTQLQRGASSKAGSRITASESPPSTHPTTQSLKFTRQVLFVKAQLMIKLARGAGTHR